MPRPSSAQIRFSIAVFIMAFGVRLEIARIFDYLYRMRMTEIAMIAVTFARTGEFANPYGYISGPTAHSTPPLPVFLAGIIALLGIGPTAQALITTIACAASALRCALTPLFAEEAGLGRGVAILSGLFGIVYVGGMDTEVSGTLDGPFVALAFMTTLWWAMRLWRSATWQYKTPWGFIAFCGFSALLNPQVLPLIAGLLAVGLYGSATEWRKRFLKQAALLCAGIFLVLLPWGIRNYIQMDAFILTRSNFGKELWLSNGPGRTFNYPPNYARLDPVKNVEEARKVINDGEPEYNRAKLEEAVSWILANPGAFAGLTLRRSFAWWFPQEGLWWVNAGAAAPALLSFAGVWILWPRHRLPALLFLTTWLTFPDFYYLIHWNSRYRYPMDWIFTIAMMVPICYLWGVWRGKPQPAAAAPEPRLESTAPPLKVTGN